VRGRALGLGRILVLVSLAFAQDGGAEAATEIVRQLVNIFVAVDLDCHLGCVADDVAVVAPLKMIF
jgi:hypothetical protein